MEKGDRGEYTEWGKTHIMTIRTVTHAPDGGMFDHAVCEEPTGDTVFSEAEVTCIDCACKVEQADQILVARLERRGFRFDGNWK